ncbi:hypothetical protein [Circoviridae sp.]|nr:hypothetical protein [Circoviridae sp.]UOF78164.1 hypothetical protein [Circoviridae sp.]
MRLGLLVDRTIVTSVYFHANCRMPTPECTSAIQSGLNMWRNTCRYMSTFPLALRHIEE